MIFVSDLDKNELGNLLARFGMQIVWISHSETIPGSFWGDPEAGLIGNSIYLRDDTPLHSAFHEACHFICMDQDRRSALHTTSGGNDPEENAVCYLQILLADEIHGAGKTHMLRDMDSWGYSFRLGSAQQWFEKDAEDARLWLIASDIIDANENILWKVRQ